MTTPEKKLIVCQICLSPSQGGLESMAVTFAQFFFENLGVSYSVCLSGSSIEGKLKSLDQPFLSMDSGLSFFSKIRKLLAFVDKHNVSHLIIHRLKDLRLTFWIRKLRPKIKIIGLAHIFVDSKKTDFLHRLIYSQLDCLVALTEIQRKALLKTLPLSESKIKVIPLGIDTRRFNHAPKPSLRQDIPSLLCVGRFDPQKGQLELIKAFHRLLSKGLKARLVLIGEDTYGEPGTKDRCNEYIENNQLCENIEILPFQTDIEKTFASFDIFIMPSHQETFGLVLVEAMASGCLCISTRAGGPIEILQNGALGLLAEPKSITSLEEKISIAINDFDTYFEIRQKSYQKARDRYNYSQMKEEFINLCRNY